MGCGSSAPVSKPDSLKAKAEGAASKEAKPSAVVNSSNTTSNGGGGPAPATKVEDIKPELKNAAEDSTSIVSMNETVAVEAIKHKVKRGAQFLGNSVEVSSSYVKKVVTKSEEDAAFIKSGLSTHFIFAQLDNYELNDVVAAMERETVPKGHVIIKQGDSGTYFYLTQFGHFNVFVKDAEGKDAKVFEYDVMGGFGELALLYDCPRAASVIASVDSVVWKLDRETFRHTLAANTEKNFTDARDAVCKVPLLQDLSAEQLTKIAEAVQTLHYKRDDKIITKGDTGSLFYIVKSGSVVCTDLGSEQHKLDDLHLGVGDYFGERALLLNEPRAATVIVTSEEVTCLVLDRDQFEMLLGPLKEQLDFNLGLRVLASVEMLTKLSDDEKDMLVQNLDTRIYNEGEYVIRQGEKGEEFFIVKNGELNVTTKTVDMLEPIVVAKLKSGSFFGEQALLNDSPRGANVVAVSPVTVFVLARTKFEAIFGSLQSILERVVEDRQIEVKKALQEKCPAFVSNIPFENLDAIKTLGTGTFGRVKIAKDKVTGKVYALKILQKAQIVAFRQQKNVMNEKMILMQANHPFVLQLIQTFKSRDCLFMLLELVQGGELFSLLHNQGGKIESKKAQFYAACVLSVLAFLHEKSILYRDLKPENLLIDAQGYIKVVDFGFAKIVKDRTFTLCGTPEYLAPELVLGKGHNKGVDYWALGVLIYEMLNGVSPFADTQRGDQMTICRNILKGKLEFPNKLRDNDAKDLIKQLLHRDPTFRIGSLKDGAEDIKRHAWFKDLNWNDLLAKKLTAPWIPPLANELDSSNFEDYEEDDYVNEYVPEAGAVEWDADF